MIFYNRKSYINNCPVFKKCHCAGFIQNIKHSLLNMLVHSGVLYILNNIMILFKYIYTVQVQIIRPPNLNRFYIRLFSARWENLFVCLPITTKFTIFSLNLPLTRFRYEFAPDWMDSINEFMCIKCSQSTAHVLVVPKMRIVTDVNEN